MRLGIDASNIRAGGGITHLSELLEAANPEIHGFKQIVVWGGQDTLKQLPNRSWLQSWHIPSLDRSLLYRVNWQTNSLAKLARLHCDVLFTPGATYPGEFEPVVTMSQNLLPFVPDERRRFGRLGALRYSLLERKQTQAFRRAAGIIFLTETARQTVIERTGPLNGRTAIIPHGISRRFRKEPVAQLNSSHYSIDRPFRLLYVSIINLYKHQWHVAEAVNQLRSKGIPVALDLIGPAYPPALKKLETILERVDPASEYLRYLGSVPYFELQRNYHTADAFIFASSCENMPNILIEAMAAGLPIVCSNRGPMPEVLGSAGIYFNPEDPNDIAIAIERLMADPYLRERNAWDAYQKSQQYTWERCSNETFLFLAAIQ